MSATGHRCEQVLGPRLGLSEGGKTGKEETMGVLYDSLAELAAVQDAELLDGYARYEAQLEAILTPQEMRAYADHLRRRGKIRIFEEMSPAELEALPAPVAAVAEKVIRDLHVSMENRRVVALLDQRGALNTAPAEGDYTRRLGTNGVE